MNKKPEENNVIRVGGIQLVQYHAHLVFSLMHALHFYLGHEHHFVLLTMKKKNYFMQAD